MGECNGLALSCIWCPPVFPGSDVQTVTQRKPLVSITKLRSPTLVRKLMALVSRSFWSYVRLHLILIVSPRSRINHTPAPFYLNDSCKRLFGLPWECCPDISRKGWENFCKFLWKLSHFFILNVISHFGKLMSFLLFILRCWFLLSTVFSWFIVLGQRLCVADRCERRRVTSCNLFWIFRCHPIGNFLVFVFRGALSNMQH